MSQHPSPAPASRPDVVVRDLWRSRHLFRNDAAFAEFVDSLTIRGEAAPAQVLTLKGRTICAAIDVEQHRELLYDRLVDTMVQRPELLGELRAALDDDDLVSG